MNTHTQYLRVMPESTFIVRRNKANWSSAIQIRICSAIQIFNQQFLGMNIIRSFAFLFRIRRRTDASIIMMVWLFAILYSYVPIWWYQITFIMHQTIQIICFDAAHISMFSSAANKLLKRVGTEVSEVADFKSWYLLIWELCSRWRRRATVARAA